jgi:hypothetical protein
METLHEWIAGLTLAAGVCCMVVFVAGCVISLITQTKAGGGPDEPAKHLIDGRAITPISVPDLTDLVKALAALADSLSKATPRAAALIGGIFFFVLAALMTSNVLAAPCDPNKACTAANPAGTMDAANSAASAADGGNESGSTKNGS